MKDWNTKQYTNKIRRRFFSLFLPYMIWNVIAISQTIAPWVYSSIFKGEHLDLLVDFFKTNGISLFWNSSICGQTESVFGFTFLNDAPHLIPMWYVRDLMVVCLLAPAIHICIRRVPTSFFVIITLAYLIRAWFPISGLSITSTFYFSLGALFVVRSINIECTINSILPLVILFVCVTVPFLVYNNGELLIMKYISIRNIFTLLESILVLKLGFALTNYKIQDYLERLSSTSFFVYALHTIVLRIVRKTIIYLFPDSDTLVYITTPFSCIILCLTVYLILKNYNSGVLYILTGNRHKER